MIVLGVESSCDETAVAIVGSDRTIHANIIASQFDAHAPYGGVVPEIAARAHLDVISRLVHEALAKAKLGWKDIDAIAATAGPGLIGGVIIGLTVAKGMAFAAGKDLMPINHLEGHALTPRLTGDVPFPYLLLLVSGGHTQLLAVEGVGKYQLLGSTMDDAVGEAFDKTAKMLGLGYPGGPAVEKLAKSGDAKRFDFPRSMVGQPHCDFSFSGLKTAVLRAAQLLPQPINEQDKADLCASFQSTVAAIMADRLSTALERFAGAQHIVVAGGVAANQHLRGALETVAKEKGLPFSAPPISLCTDNAAMIAWAGIERLNAGFKPEPEAGARARWPLMEL